MRALTRMTLPRRVLDVLGEYQQRLDREVARERTRRTPDVAACVTEHWSSRRRNLALIAVETALKAMSTGLQRCMYCEESRGADIEHFEPKERAPERAFAWPNLLFVCTICNRQKSTNFDPAMIDPTAVDPLDHLMLSFTTGCYSARPGSAPGAATLRVLPRLESDQPLILGRQHAWTKLQVLLQSYEDAHTSGDTARAKVVRDVVTHEPFSAVFAAALCAARAPNAPAILGVAFVQRLQRRPEIARWLAEADKASRREARERITVLAPRVRRPSA